MDELAVLDREAFAQVWGRVDPKGGGPVEVAGPPEAAEPPETRELPEAGEGQGLQQLVLTLLQDEAGYRDMARRGGRSAGTLRELERRKLAQARRAGSAYFLLSGVRYWPRATVSPRAAEPPLPALRRRFLAERELAERLAGLSQGAADEGLIGLYAALAGETRDMADALRRAVEREMS